eukprot:CAMPEP_0202056008 /NCGR_PEP_ID=MMETSP0963-20130614/21712_1 /ASSEMBLY_ACC=CAM_ASM_000494 /TAXON_ID=4773 /ORGANISM="Schizochytrium aggregatum, Strain ATCC28209" /LENGTH=39 /DNA_ID= /DNA_START= /DNA_END= /DNA_ORIENTATION=
MALARRVAARSCGGRRGGTSGVAREHGAGTLWRPSAVIR